MKHVALSKWSPKKMLGNHVFIFKWYILEESGLPGELAGSNAEFTTSHLPQTFCVSLNFPVEVGFTKVTSTHLIYPNITCISIIFSYRVICQMNENGYIDIGLGISFSYFGSCNTLLQLSKLLHKLLLSLKICQEVSKDSPSN